jgi:carbohydrate kinase (thermoresistant glucokinase family)
MNARIIYIIGVSGSGKTTIGKKLSAKTTIPFFDADDLHSTASKEKMKAGLPLTDKDREGWLRGVNELAKKQMKNKGAIIACSALKEKYRTVLAEGIIVPVSWVFLKGSFVMIQERMKKRKDHFMPPALLSSQFETLEIPHHALTIDVSKTPDEIVEIILAEIRTLS